MSYARTHENVSRGGTEDRNRNSKARKGKHLRARKGKTPSRPKSDQSFMYHVTQGISLVTNRPRATMSSCVAGGSRLSVSTVFSA